MLPAASLLGSRCNFSCVVCVERGPDPKDALKISYLVCVCSGSVPILGVLGAISEFLDPFDLIKGELADPEVDEIQPCSEMNENTSTQE